MITLFHVHRGVKLEDSISVITNKNGTVLDTGTEIPASNFMKKKYKLNSYFVSLFIMTMKNSDEYRTLVTNALLKNLQIVPHLVLFKLNMYDGKHPIDYHWNNIITQLCYEKREMNTAMAWLSTLGGAFSALGDYQEDLASVAGRISVEQLRLALKFGDPPAVARCKLFYALSLIQRGKLKRARNIIRETYQISITQFAEDKRLQRMCLGIWTRLRYEWEKKYKHLR